MEISSGEVSLGEVEGTPLLTLICAFLDKKSKSLIASEGGSFVISAIMGVLAGVFGGRFGIISSNHRPGTPL